MKKVIKEYMPKNPLTTTIKESPAEVNSGIIKAVMQSGDKISIAQIDLEKFADGSYQYIITPYWDIIDGLPASVFYGIPGIDMTLRLEKYYRVNCIPSFILERTPCEHREDVMEYMSSVGLDCYDRFEWLIRTTMHSANDNLIVDRKEPKTNVVDYNKIGFAEFQYGDKIIAESLETFAVNSCAFSKVMFIVSAQGVDVINSNGEAIIDNSNRTPLVSVAVIRRMLEYAELLAKRQKGREKAKACGKYTGRKPIDVDKETLRQVATELEMGIINTEEAMKRTKINSRSTFYRKLKQMKEDI